MSRLSLTFACGHYDRTEALRTGIVRPRGSTSTTWRSRRRARSSTGWSAASSSRFRSCRRQSIICLTASGEVPDSSRCRSSRRARSATVSSTSTRRPGIRSPKDLEGKRVGVALYTQTAAIYIRGHLAQQYGVDLSKIHWVQGAVEQAGTHGKPHSLPVLKPVDLVQSESPHSLGDLLASGEIDALIGSRRPLTLGVHPGRRAALSGFSRDRTRFLPADEDLPDHAPRCDSKRRVRAAPLGREQPLQSVRRSEELVAGTDALLRLDSHDDALARPPPSTRSTRSSAATRGPTASSRTVRRSKRS